MKLFLLVVVVAFFAFFVGFKKGRKYGKKELFQEICLPHEEWSGALSSGGMIFEVKTKFVGQEIRLAPKFVHPFGDCDKKMS